MNYYFRQQECKLIKKKYFDGHYCLQLVSVNDSLPILTCTLNAHAYNIKLENNEVIIKDYDENIGVLDFLLSNDLIELTSKKIELNSRTIPVCAIK